MKKSTYLEALVVLGLMLSLTLSLASSGVAAEMPGHSMESIDSMDSMHNTAEQAGQFQAIEQPLINKVAVTIGGLGLIGLELWWFLFSKPKSS
jgi:plastocyanin domain-containing protein